MRILRVRHLTRYRYAKPVRFGEHRLMLRPRDDADQKVTLERLVITPQPLELNFIRDGLGNWVGLARFDGAADELCFESDIQLVRPPAASLIGPQSEPWTIGTPVLDSPSAALDADGGVARWALGFLQGGDAQPGLEVLAAMAGAIHDGFSYRRRLEHGVQPPWRTLALRSGACRDFAMLMIAGARALGLQARFASGYVHSPDRFDRQGRAGGGHTHAWASICTPERGWTDFDPTSGAVGADELIRVAVADDPVQAIPIQGVYFGGPDDFLGMDVQVEVEMDLEPQASSANCAVRSEPQPNQGVGWNTA